MSGARRGIRFSPTSEAIGFNYRNAPGEFTEGSTQVATSNTNGQGYKKYKVTAPNPAPNKTRFYKEGAFLGPQNQFSRMMAIRQAYQNGEMRIPGLNAKEWANALAREEGTPSAPPTVVATSALRRRKVEPPAVSVEPNSNNNNVQTKSLCNRVCNAFGKCFCRRRGGRMTRKHHKKQKHHTRKGVTRRR